MNSITELGAPDFSITRGGGSEGSDLKSFILDFIYPVGSYFITENTAFNTAAKVKNHFGGTWIQVTDCFLYGSNSSSAIGTTGGSVQHKHSLGTPNDTDARALIQFNYYDNGGGIGSLVADYTPGYKPSEAFIVSGTIISNHDYGDRSGATRVVGDTKTANSMPPYRTVFMYRRLT